MLLSTVFAIAAPSQVWAQAATAPDAGVAAESAAPEAPPAAVAEPTALPEDSVVPSQDLRRGAERAQLVTLRARLLELEREQDDVDRVLPWSVFALGAAALVVGAVIGIERASACDASCSGPFWPSWLVVGGATVGTLGLVWLKLEHEELSELRSRHYHLKNQIDAYELERAALAPRLTLRAAF